MSWNPTEYYKDEAVAAAYDAERFDSVAGRVFTTLERRALRRALATVARDALVLDLPCGTGRLAEELLRAGYRVVGADISPAMLAVAEKRLKGFGGRFRTMVCDARTLATGAADYDAALCARVLMHFPLPEQIEFLRGVARVTRGPVVLIHGIDSPYLRSRRALKAVLRHQRPSRYPVTRRALGELLGGAGLRLRRLQWILPLVSEAVVITAEHG